MAFGDVVKYVKLSPASLHEYDKGIELANKNFRK